MHRIVALLILVPAIALAQTPPPPEAPPAAPEAPPAAPEAPPAPPEAPPAPPIDAQPVAAPAPAPSPPPPADPAAECRYHRAEGMQQAQATADPDERARLLAAVADCSTIEAPERAAQQLRREAQLQAAIADCKEHRSAQMHEAQASVDMGERTRLLTSLPDCTELEAKTRASWEPARPAGPRSGASGEFGIGVAMLDGPGFSDWGLGIAFGGGSFVQPNFSLNFRVAGGLYSPGNDTVFIGFVGPDIQVWPTPQLYIGGGIGESFAAGCGGDDCGEVHEFGWELRGGVAFDKAGHGANLTFHVNELESLTSFAVMLGYQDF